MKKIYALLTALVLTIAATGQTLNVKVGSVTYQFPASQTGEMTYKNGTTLTIMGKKFTLADIDAMTIDNSSVKMEEHLPDYFMRIHRSYIINLTKIQEVNKNRVIMDSDTYLPIGDLYKEAFQTYLEGKFLGK